MRSSVTAPNADETAPVACSAQEAPRRRCWPRSSSGASPTFACTPGRQPEQSRSAGDSAWCARCDTAADAVAGANVVVNATPVGLDGAFHSVRPGVAAVAGGGARPRVSAARRRHWSAQRASAATARRTGSRCCSSRARSRSSDGSASSRIAARCGKQSCADHRARRSVPRSRRAPARELAISSDAHDAGRRCRSAAAARVRRVRAAARGGRPWHRVRALLGPTGPAPVPAMHGAVTRTFDIAADGAICFRRSFAPRGPSAGHRAEAAARSCTRSSTTVACRRGWHGRANGPARVAARCSRGASGARAGAALAARERASAASTRAS